MPSPTPRIALSLLLLATFTSRASADLVPGADWYLKNAEVVVLARAQTEAEARAFPPPRGQQRLNLSTVLKGFTTQQYWLVGEGRVKPGQEVAVLQSYQAIIVYEPAICVELHNPRAQKLFVWPITDGKAKTGVPAATGGDFFVRDEPLTVTALREQIAKQTPEAVDLQEHVLAVLLFPDKEKALAGKDPQRVVQVRFLAAVLDLERDVSTLAGLLESPDGTVREAATARLATLTGEKIAAPREDSPVEREAWAARWRDWWIRNRDERVWDEAKAQWRVRVKTDSPSRWPAIPDDPQQPLDVFPAPLLQAIEKNDPAAFAPAFRAWLDSGARRDRLIHHAARLPDKLRTLCHLEGGGGPYLGPAPRLPHEVLFGGKVSVGDRARVFAKLALFAHFDRFLRERQLALKQVENEPVGSELLRRAAFWELRETNIRTPGELALKKVALSTDKADQRALLAIFKSNVEAALFAACQDDYPGDRKALHAILLDHLRCKNDHSASQAAYYLAQIKHPEVLPLLLDKIKEKDPAVRKWAAYDLCWYPSKDTVPGLLAAIEAEKDTEVKAELLNALAMTGDPRGLDALMAAAKTVKGRPNVISVARGLGRIKDKKALPVLAEMAQRASEDQERSEAVNAFGWVSGLYPAFEPAGWPTGFVDLDRVNKGLEAIKRWQREQPK
jgi:hypothetical protein